MSFRRLELEARLEAAANELARHYTAERHLPTLLRQAVERYGLEVVREALERVGPAGPSCPGAVGHTGMTGSSEPIGIGKGGELGTKYFPYPEGSTGSTGPGGPTGAQG